MPMKTITHHHQTNAQSVLKLSVLSPRPTSISVYLVYLYIWYREHDAIWQGMSLWSLGVNCFSCCPLNFLCTLSLITSGTV